jgi:hypothetical protein
VNFYFPSCLPRFIFAILSKFAILGKAHKSIFSRITVFGRLGGRGFRFGRYEKSERIDFSWSGQIQTLTLDPKETLRLT